MASELCDDVMCACECVIPQFFFSIRAVFTIENYIEILQLNSNEWFVDPITQMIWKKNKL